MVFIQQLIQTQVKNITLRKGVLDGQVKLQWSNG